MRCRDAFRRTAVVAVLGLLGPLAQAGGAAACPGVTGSGGWSSIALPDGATTTSFAVAATRGRPDTLYVTQGRVVHRSADGGCTWQQAFSLDALPASVLAALPTYNVVSLAVGPAPASGPQPVWVLAADTESTLTVPMPVLTAVSRDGGKTWTVHEPAPEQSVAPELPGGHPRCTSVSRVLRGAQPGTAYLYCDGASFAAYFLLVTSCRTSFYVTRDWGATWGAVYPRLADPAQATDPRLGCAPPYQALPQADRYQQGVVWTAWSDGVHRSAQDGRAPAMFAPFTAASEYVSGMDVGALRSGKPLVLLRTNTRLLSSTGGKPKPVPTMPVPASERGVALGGAVLDRSDRVFVAYFDGRRHAAAWLLDVGRGTWRRLAAPPKRADKQEAWLTYLPLELADDPASPYVYVRSYAESRVLRHAVR